jgi:hypothetical protein
MKTNLKYQRPLYQLAGNQACEHQALARIGTKAISFRSEKRGRRSSLKGYLFSRTNNAPIYDRINGAFRALSKYTRRGWPDICLIANGQFIGIRDLSVVFEVGSEPSMPNRALFGRPNTSWLEHAGRRTPCPPRRCRYTAILSLCRRCNSSRL